MPTRSLKFFIWLEGMKVGRLSFESEEEEGRRHRWEFLAVFALASGFACRVYLCLG